MLIWCLPPIVLVRGIRQKDRFVIAVGAIVAILTLVSNKPYLGWQRHTWDPMLLGILLTGVAFFIRRWLARGPGGIRHGFTAGRLSGKDKHWMNVGSSRIRPAIAPLNNARPANKQSGRPLRWGTFGRRRRHRRFLKDRGVDRSSADVAQNSGRHAPQRTSATGEIAVSLPINVVALAQAHGPNCRVLDRWRAFEKAVRRKPLGRRTRALCKLNGAKERC